MIFSLTPCRPEGQHRICEIIVIQNVTIQMPDAFPTRGFPESEKGADYIMVKVGTWRYIYLKCNF